MISQRQSKEQCLEYLLGNIMDLGVPRSRGSGCQNLNEQSDINKGQDRAISQKARRIQMPEFYLKHFSIFSHLLFFHLLPDIFFHGNSKQPIEL